jgi:hypothetical protein
VPGLTGGFFFAKQSRAICVVAPGAGHAGAIARQKVLSTVGCPHRSNRSLRRGCTSMSFVILCFELSLHF